MVDKLKKTLECLKVFPAFPSVTLLFWEAFFFISGKLLKQPKTEEFRFQKTYYISDYSSLKPRVSRPRSSQKRR